MDKAEKYDRQIRLWGAQGQERIEGASVVCLGASAVMTETLKNLILPGVGSYTIADGQKVQNEDLGTNFFLTLGHLGRSRAEATCELLQELNEDVKGAFKSTDPNAVIDEQIQWFDQFTVVMATGLSQSSLKKLAYYLAPKNVPLVLVTSLGLIGYVRVQVSEHLVIESKPDNSLDDLRLTAPWPELTTFCESIQLSELDDQKHGHIPYVVILFQTLQEWKKSHGGREPSTFREKEEFKAQIMTQRRSDEEANFPEAFAEAKNAWVPTDIPETVQKLFQSSKCTQENANDFWVCILALRHFAERHKCLPLSGSLPDMNSDTQSYQAIQRLYQEKASKDRLEVTQYINDVLRLSGRADYSIPEEYVSLFCKNAHFLCSVETRSLSQEAEASVENGALLTEAIEMDMYGTPKWLLCLKAVEQFTTDYSRAPGYTSEDLDTDAIALRNFCEQRGLSSALVSDESLQEICRFGGGELHTVSATLGGIVAQEVIKLITHQLVPLNNTLIVDSINCSTAMFEA